MKEFLQILKRFSPFFKDFKVQFFFAIIGMILAALGTAGLSYILEPTMDGVFVEKGENYLKLIPFAIIAIFLAKSLGNFMQTYFTGYIGQNVVRIFREKILSTLIYLDMSFFHKFRTGELMSRTINDVERIRTIISNMIPEFFTNLITIIGLLGVVIYQSPKLAFFALIVLPCAVYPLSRLAKRMRRISKASQEKTADINSVLSEIYSNIEIVKANNAQKSEIKRFSEENYRIYRLNFKAIITNGFVSPLMEMLGGIGIAIVIYIGGKEVIDGAMTLGKFTSFVAALFMLYTPIKKVTSVFNNMQDAIVASNRTFELIDKTPSIIGGKKEFPKNINSLSFQNVSLNYGEKTALKNINFSVNKGQTIALVGNSGGGKTSIVNLIMRFYDTTSGNILVNNDDLCEFSLESLRENIGFVSQRIYIFNDTIANNVAYGKTYDEEKVINALKSANAYEFVMGLENGIHTNLNEFGTNISGGQRQRIAIARALYNNPQILIFDEATSALDNVSEKAITEVIEKIKTDKIVFIIAHRLSTIENAGKIAVISNGEIVGFGDDEKLVRECEIYQKLKGNFAYENKDTSEK